MMIKVVIIDDEALVRVGLKSMINWDENGYEVVGEASNGQQGIEIINKYKPDIVITDIKMPVLDGLEMIKMLVDQGEKSKFIILSSYDEFQLVKQSMKLGATEYLIKLELEPETLIAALTQAKNKMRLEQVEFERKNLLEKHVRLNKPIFREDFFKKLITSAIREREEILENISLLEIEIEEERLVCVFIKVHELENFEKFGKEDTQLIDFSVINIVDEILNDVFKGYAFKWNMMDYVAVFSFKKEWEFDFLRQKVTDTATRLIQMLKQYFSLCVTIGISDTHSDFTELGKAFLEATQAVQYGFYKGSDNYIFYEEYATKQDTVETIGILEYKNRLKKAIELFDTDEIHEIFKGILVDLGRKNVTREKSFDMCCQIAYHISGILEDEEVLNSAMGHHSSLYAEISGQNSLPEIIKWLEKLEKVLCNLLKNNQNHQNNRLIVKAKKYINTHIKKEITLNGLASLLGLSPGYLSTLFKQVSGQNFIDYVTTVKIDYAKVLMKETNLKIYEVSEVMGFENAYYFSRVFKKVTGMTPRDFLAK